MAESVRALARDYALEARIKAFLKETALVEQCPGLCWTAPPKKSDFRKIFPFYLAPEKRPDRSMAPCPVCSPNAPQYYHGWLVWFPVEQVYRCIGQHCAGHFIGREQALAADREYEARTRSEADFTFAFDNLGSVPAMLRYMTALVRACSSTEALLRSLGKAHMRGALYNIVRGNAGVLRLWTSAEVERLDPRTGETKTVTVAIPEDCGVLSGWCALGPNNHFVKAIRIELERLRHFNTGEGEAAQEWVIDNGQAFPEDLGIFRAAVIRVHDVRRRALRHLAEVRGFFSAENFDLLAKFGSDARNAHTFYARHSNGEFRIGETSVNAVRLRPEFTALDQLPAWPEIVQSNG